MTQDGRMPGLADGTRLLVRAGSPTAEEVVAIALALDAATRTDTQPSAPRRPAWVVASRREGLGGAPAATRSDVHGWGA